MIHPVFAGVPDRETAEAFSEMMVPGQFTFSTGGPKGTLPGNHTDFPPEPAYIANVTGAFIPRAGEGVRRFAAHNMADPSIAPGYKEVAASYAAQVGIFGRVVAEINAEPELYGLEPTTSRYGAVGEWAINSARAAGKRLVAAHVMYVTPDGKRIFDALCHPKEMHRDFPLLLRDLLKPLAMAKPEEMEAEDIQISPPLQKLLADLMVQSHDSEVLGGIPAAGILPTAPQYRQITKQAFGTR